MIKKITFLILFSVLGFSQNFQLTEQANVSILTCGTGPETYAMYGHTAIRIEDKNKNLDIVYNYGAFDFSTPNFALRFIKGDMQYFITQDIYAQFEANYTLDNRTIYEQVLNLNLTQKQNLFNQLNLAINSDSRYYTYKFINRNCTTMVVDKINESLNKKNALILKNNKQTFREILFPYMNNFWQKLGIQLIFGQKVDTKTNAVFLPLDLKKSLANLKINNKPLVSKTKVIFESNYKPEFSFFNSIYLLICVLILLVLVNKKQIQLIYFYLAGFLGVFFVWVGFYSLHEEVLSNYNILLFNPLLLLFALFYQKKKSKQLIFIGKILILCLLIYIIFTANKVQFYTVIPILIFHFYWIIKIINESKKKLLTSKVYNGS